MDEEEVDPQAMGREEFLSWALTEVLQAIQDAHVGPKTNYAALAALWRRVQGLRDDLDDIRRIKPPEDPLHEADDAELLEAVREMVREASPEELEVIEEELVMRRGPRLTLLKPG